MKKSLLIAATLMVAGVSVQAQEVTPPAKAQIEVYNGSSYSYAIYEDVEWQSQIAISGNQMYVKNIFPNIQNTKWIVGTISGSKVVFERGQIVGDQDQSLMGGEEKYENCMLYGIDDDFNTTDATFSWNEATKTLKSIDYEVASCIDWQDEDGEYMLAMNDAFDGTSDSDATFTLVGTGEIVDPTPSAPTVYLRGEFNEWGTTHAFVEGETKGVYTISLDELSGVFKIATEDWSTVDLGGNAGDALTVGTPYALVENGANLALGSTVKNAVVTYNANEKTVTVTGDEVLTYYMKHPWGTGLDADWSWKELTDNGDGSYSRDFTYIDNVIQANELAATIPSEVLKERAAEYNAALPERAPIDMVFNVAYGGNTTLNSLFACLRKNLARYDSEIGGIEPIYRENRAGDIPHSQASIAKGQKVLGYQPKFDALSGFEQACEWYWNNLK